MGFAIHTKEDVAVSILDLDKEAQEFWGRVSTDRSYASPTGDYGYDWFNIIGWSIHKQINYTTGWNNVVLSMYNIHMEGMPLDLKGEGVTLKTPEQMLAHLTRINAFLLPMIQLVQHWEKKGYVPVQVKD